MRLIFAEIKLPIRNYSKLRTKVYTVVNNVKITYGEKQRMRFFFLLRTSVSE